MADQMLTTAEAATVLGFAPQTLANKRSRGGGPRYVKLDGAVRYRRSDLERWVEENTRDRTPMPQRGRRRAS